MSDDEERPPHKDEEFNIAMDSGLHDDARKFAGSDKRLRAMIRAFLRLVTMGEYPPIPEDAIQQELRRAQKVPRKKKK